jgi:hypothetical protein
MFQDILLSISDSQNYLLPILLVIFSLILWKLWNISSIQLDPQEPPLIQPKIPIIGHILGIIQYPHQYLFELK